MQNTLAKMSSICSQLISASVVSVNIQSISARSSSRNGIRRNLHHVVTSTKNVATITPCKTTASTVTACSLKTHDLRRSMKNICQLKSTRWWQWAELGITGTYPHKPNKCSVCNAVEYELIRTWTWNFNRTNTRQSLILASQIRYKTAIPLLSGVQWWIRKDKARPLLEVPSVLWHWLLGQQEGHQHIKSLCHLSQKVVFQNKWSTKTEGN